MKIFSEMDSKSPCTIIGLCWWYNIKLFTVIFYLTYSSSYVQLLWDIFHVSNNIYYLQDHDSAIDLATKALEIKPNSFEAFYARARAKRDNRQGDSALEDLKEALKLAPNNRELQRLLMRVRDECREQARYENIQGSQQSLTEHDRRREETAL